MSGLGSYLAAESSGNNGLDRLRGGAYILTEGQNLFVPCGFLPVIILLQSKENMDKGAVLRKVHYSDATRHIYTSSTSKPYPCISCVGVEEVVGNQDRV